MHEGFCWATLSGMPTERELLRALGSAFQPPPVGSSTRSASVKYFPEADLGVASTGGVPRKPPVL